ncbi:MAG: carboxymuconolactone decarboxylase family protein [Bacteroidetes bacterium]|nr:carboxymuconolactone decarboxylase family protein [Bacteroidota bacterium]
MNTELMYKMQMPLVQLEHSTETQKKLLNAAKKEYRMIPNMYKAMANSPILLKSYMAGYNEFRQNSSFSPSEHEVVFLTISVENNCSYCMAAHSLVADMVSKVPPNVTDAIRNGTEIDDPKLKSLAAFTAIMVNKRGNPDEEDVQQFFENGYSEKHILDIILAISIKTISNYTNHVFHTELDAAFRVREWKSFKVIRTLFNGMRNK